MNYGPMLSLELLVGPHEEDKGVGEGGNEDEPGRAAGAGLRPAGLPVAWQQLP
jgi:hypothetical protein